MDQLVKDIRFGGPDAETNVLHELIHRNLQRPDRGVARVDTLGAAKGVINDIHPTL